MTVCLRCESDKGRQKKSMMRPLYISLARTLCFAFLSTVVVALPTFSQTNAAQEYIEQYKDIAVQYMEEHGCPASIILAIAMHESAHGNSRVARHLNNHFGIKGKNNSKTIRSAYKGYDSVEASYQDFIDFLKRRKATQQLFDQYEPHEYQKWVQGIARSGYAHSPTWSSRVVGMIRKYNLHELDRQPDGEIMLALNDEQVETYTVKKGDTLSAIAKQFGTTVKSIQRNNKLVNTKLQIGQQLIL